MSYNLAQVTTAEYRCKGRVDRRQPEPAFFPARDWGGYPRGFLPKWHSRSQTQDDKNVISASCWRLFLKPRLVALVH